MKIVILLIISVAIFAQTVNNTTTSQDIQVPDEEKSTLEKFQQYIKDFNRAYKSLDELTAKYQVFKGNYKRVITLQSKYDAKPNKNKFGITKFMDLTNEEFESQYANLKLSESDLQESIEATKKTEEGEVSDPTAEVPPTQMADGTNPPNLRDSNPIPPVLGAPFSFDWRTQGVVGPVKNQGSCGACWAFSANVNLEGLYARRYGVFRSFSEEQLLDCDLSNNGCFGGNQQNVFTYVQRAGGLMSSASYPYTGVKNGCYYRASNAIAVGVRGWTNVGTNEEAIKNYLYNNGPLAVAINLRMLQYYTGGIITSGAATCSPYILNHGVALVGYGSQNGINYWIVKNSWGANWGEGGYFRIARGYGTCGINRYVVSAILN